MKVIAYLLYGNKDEYQREFFYSIASVLSLRWSTPLWERHSPTGRMVTQVGDEVDDRCTTYLIDIDVGTCILTRSPLNREPRLWALILREKCIPYCY